MIPFIKKLFVKYYDIIAYLFFGVLTTLVNYLIYFPLHNLLNISAAVSNVIAWFGAVIFAYLTNKPFVFKSNNWSLHFVVPEFCKFIGGRIGSGLLETLIIFLCVDVLCWNSLIIKIGTSVLVVILNYVISKLIVFKKK